MRSRRKILLLFCSVLFAAVYAISCWIVLKNSSDVEKVATRPVAGGDIQKALKFTLFHGGSYYRELAQRTQYYPHNPAELPAVFHASILKSPADHKNFFAYAYYMASRECCRQKSLDLLKETLRRAPYDASMYKVAASIFISQKQGKAALDLVRRALDLRPESASVLYPLLEQNGFSQDVLIQVTPEKPDAFLQLAQYLVTKRNLPKAHETLTRLSSMELDDRQRLLIARMALNAGMPELARSQAKAAVKSEDYRAEALQCLSEIAIQEEKWPEFNNLARQTEQEILEQNGAEAAAQYALAAANRIASHDRSASLKEKVLRILNDYPHYAAAYIQMADLSKDSSEIELFYVKKAVEQDQSNLAYKKRLASLYLKLSKREEAENIYRSLLAVPETQKDAYLGLADCQVQAGNRLEAIVLLEQGLQRLGPQEDLHARLGELYDSIGEYEKAAIHYIDYARLTKTQKSKGYNFAGDAYWKAGSFLLAKQQYNQTLSYEPQNAHAREFLDRIQTLGY